MTTKPNDLYTHVVDVTSIYLGPTAERFISRQIRNHLQKSPEALLKEDLKELITWLQISMAFLTDDSNLIKHYVDDLWTLSKHKTNEEPSDDSEFSRAS